MAARIRYRSFLLALVVLISTEGLSQTIPPGMHYQAVARDNMGKELTDKEIDVRFSIISGNSLGPVVYQEVHAKVRTSQYGVFSIIIGRGEVTGGTVTSLTQVDWGNGTYFLKVEVKFNNDFVYMGTMQFLAVPYALYAMKSLEPGPQGPQGVQGIQGPQGPQGLKGDQGDPASNNQKLSFDGSNLSIGPNGNTVNLSVLNAPHLLSVVGDTISILGGNKQTLPNQIQDLLWDNINANTLKISKSSGSGVDMSRFLQTLSFDSVTMRMSISNGNSQTLSPLLQNLQFDSLNNKLRLTKSSSPEISLKKYLDNTDNQTLSYNPENYQLSVSNGNSIPIGTIIAFRAGITASLNLPNNTATDLIFDQVSSPPNYFNDGGYNPGSGVFQAPYNGIYSFTVAINLPFSSSSMVIKLNGANYETVIGPTAAGGYFRANLTMKLNKSDIVNVAVIQTNGFAINPYIISGAFSGFRVY
jgi:hypothetical protein